MTWQYRSTSLGSNSSPQCADLNDDGVLDIVLGSGLRETEDCPSGILAFDGATGNVLWEVPSSDQVVGSANFLDVTGDSTPDVFIGGRGQVLKCLNGIDGKLIWEFKPSSNTPKEACCLQYNFYNPQFIPDQDGDQVRDVLVSNGGNALARAFSETGRFPGVLAVFSSKTGKVLAVDTLPDGKETYMSPVVHDFDSNGKLSIIIGTGGETLGGNLFRVSLDSLMKGRISSSIKLATVTEKGFIGPPTLVDITGDGVMDIILNSFVGKMMAIDGKKNTLLWEHTVAETESYCSVTPGYFNDDDTPDFFSTFSKGFWPENKGSIFLAFDGKNGKVLYSDTVGCFGYASGVAHDLNDDGFDDVLITVNAFDCDPPSYAKAMSLDACQVTLRTFDVYQKKTTVITDPVIGKNVSSTPWIGDLNRDQKLDIVYVVQANMPQVDKFRGMKVIRASSNVTLTTEPTWGAYLGNDGTGVFTKKRK
jgi:outer membrane protein assembly factor BamB